MSDRSSWRDFFESRSFYNYEIFSQKLPLRFAVRKTFGFQAPTFPPRNEIPENPLPRRRRRRPGAFCWCCCCKISILLLAFLVLLGLVGGLSYYFSETSGQLSNSTNETSSQRPNWTTAITLRTSTRKTIVPDANTHPSRTPTTETAKTLHTKSTFNSTHTNNATTPISIATTTRIRFKTYTKPKTPHTTPTTLNQRNLTSDSTNISNIQTSEYMTSITKTLFHTNTEPASTNPTVNTFEPRTPASEFSEATPIQTTKDSPTQTTETASPEKTILLTTETKAYSSVKPTPATSTEFIDKTKSISPQTPITQHSTGVTTEDQFETGPITTTTKPVISTLESLTSSIKSTERTMDKTIPPSSNQFQTITESLHIKTPDYTLSPLTSMSDTSRDITKVISTTGGSYGSPGESTLGKTSNIFESGRPNTFFTTFGLSSSNSYSKGSRVTSSTTKDPLDISTVMSSDTTSETTLESGSKSTKSRTESETSANGSASYASRTPSNEILNTPTPKEAEKSSETSREFSTDADVTNKITGEPDVSTNEPFPKSSSIGSEIDASGLRSTEKMIQSEATTGLTNKGQRSESSRIDNFDLTSPHTPPTTDSVGDQIGLTTKDPDVSKVPETTFSSWIAIESTRVGEDFTIQEEELTTEESWINVSKTTLSDGFTDDGGSGMSEDL